MKQPHTRYDVMAMFGNPILLLLASLLWLHPAASVAQPLASGQPKFVGNVIGNGYSIRTDFAKYWNQVTAENAGKWGSVQYDTNMAYNWTQLDNIYNYAKTRGFPYRHHTLVWGPQQPKLIEKLDSARQYQQVESWIEAVGQRYPNIDFCDVVNEPLHAPPSYKGALGGDGTTGWDWVIKAFELARTYLPNTQLFLNEYNVINNGSATAQYLQVIDLLKERDLIDGIGVQGHYFEINTSATVLHNNLTTLAASGLPIHITELDIDEADDNTQLSKYQTLFPVLYDHPGVTGVTLWGYVMYEIWKPNAYLITDRLAERPALQWLRTYLATPLTPALLSPLGTTGEPRNVVLTWHPSAMATAYRVQVSTLRNFASMEVDSVVADTLLKADPLAANTQYYWRVNASNSIGVSPYSPTAAFVTGDTIVAGVADHGDPPEEYTLSQNYPNPFNPTTTIPFSVPSRSNVHLVLVNILGQVVKEIASGTFDAGHHRVALDASDLASGVYFYRMEAGSFVHVRKLALMK